MKFDQMPSDTLFYKGVRYRGWWVETQPYEKRLFADISLMYRLEEEGDTIDNRIDDEIAYYVSPNDDVEEAISDFLDGECIKEIEKI